MGAPAYRRWLAQAGHFRSETGRPLVSLCYAQSLDGCIAEQRGKPAALSNPEAGRLTHRLRSLHDAILVGVGTVLSDNPQLTVRHVQGPSPQPVILDSRLRTPADAYLVTRHPKPAWIAALASEVEREPERPPTANIKQLQDFRIISLPPSARGGVDLAALLAVLGERGISSLMVEGGARVITSFLAAGFVDWVSITVTPRFLGGLHAVESPAAHLPSLSEFYAQRLGDNIILWGRLVKAQGLLPR